MSSAKKVDFSSSKSNPSSNRSKKFPPPPPLTLPIPTTTNNNNNTTTIYEDTLSNSEKNSCLSSKDCPHEHTSYILPISQRTEIVQRLISSSSTLLTHDNKQKRSHMLNNSIPKSQQTPVPDGEWLELMRLITQKSFENELTMLLDRYKKTYFDAINSPQTSDGTIRLSLCQMVSEILTTYSMNSSLPSSDIPEDMFLSRSSTNPNPSPKRKRSSVNTISLTKRATFNLNHRTKFVISHIIPSVYDQTSNHSQKMIYQQRIKQFQTKFDHLFKYIPNEDEQVYLINEGHLKKLSTSSSRLANNQNHQFCLMLYEEVFDAMDESDLDISGISIDKSFTLSEAILANVRSCTQ